ncbi:MAG: polysaccharide biosynthesis tyrosine autokinase [Kiritimatiellia bacterium]|jgi:capsular exopolysaccharide synthesis family protein|nr:polysaccharide biosynthesis tyrosine autokinase [Kiritimatiellia bacterium]MDP7023503.1 polysaccharide biosynthesis tyrosine autokinase [Kiritimatiellia bacterium]
MDFDVSDPFVDDAPDVPSVHLRDYLQVVLQRMPLALTVFVALMLAAALYVWTRTPRYTATARLLVERSQVDLTDMKAAYDPLAAAGGQREFMQTVVNLVSSRPVLVSTIEKARLMDDEVFSHAKDPVQFLAKRLRVVPLRNTHLIDVTIEREDPRQAQRIVNAAIDAFKNDSRARRIGISDEGLEHLRSKADSLRKTLDAATKELQEFSVENNMVSFKKTQNIVADRLLEFSRELSKAEPRRMALEAQVKAADAAIANGQTVDSLPEVIDSPVMKELKLELSRLERDYTQMFLRLGENHVQIKAIVSQIDTLRTKLAMEASSILASLRIRYDQLGREESLIREALRKQEREVFTHNVLAAEYEVLNGNKSLIEDTYRTIVRRIGEIDINRMGGQGDNVFVISRATLPTVKSWPHRAKSMLVALILTGAAAVGLCFFMDYMDVTIKGAADIKLALRSSVLGGIPDMSDEIESNEMADLVVADSPKSQAAEAFRSLRTALAFGAGNVGLRSVVVSSTFPEEGKSIVSVNLAIAQAQVGKRTLIVDADLRKPRLHKVFSVSADQGLSTLLDPDTEVEVEDLLLSTTVENLSFLPCGAIPAYPAELLESARFAQLLERLEASFDFVVLDSPPSFALVDSLVIGRHAGGMLLVVRSFVTPKDAAQQVVARVRDAGVSMLGTVLNNVDVPKSGLYGYHYGHYQYAYGYGYGISPKRNVRGNGWRRWLPGGKDRSDTSELS